MSLINNIIRRFENVSGLRSVSMLSLISIISILSLTSCFEDNVEDYSEWKAENEKFLDEKIASTVNGMSEFTRFIPSWEPNAFVLMKWHNDRHLTDSKLIPLDNSTVNVKYELELCNGEKIEDSYSSTQYGDSIYQTQPCENIVGFWAGLRQMHEGDSVTMIIPWQAGYGTSSVGSIKPYSNLIYHVKLKSIVAYEIPVENAE